MSAIKIRAGFSIPVWIIMICVLFIGCTSKLKIYRVGILSGTNAFFTIANGFRLGMTELGYMEGKNIIYDIKALNADPAGEERAAKEFVSGNVDLILAFPTESALAAKKSAEGTGIPVVFACGNIEGNNLVNSISHPGGNITGVRYPGPDLVIKRLEILLELAPWIKQLYIAYDRNYPAIPPALKTLRPAAAALNITLVEDPVNDIKELGIALQQRAESMQNSMDAILVMPETLTQSPEGWELISRFGDKVPIAGSAAFEADNGAVFSYIPDNMEFGRLAASQADKIFKGTPAGSIFVITPGSQLRLNYKLAQKLGLRVNESILGFAYEIIH